MIIKSKSKNPNLFVSFKILHVIPFQNWEENVEIKKEVYAIPTPYLSRLLEMEQRVSHINFNTTQVIQ